MCALPISQLAAGGRHTRYTPADVTHNHMAWQTTLDSVIGLLPDTSDTCILTYYPVTIGVRQSIDNYWTYVMGLKKLDGSQKFPLVSKIIKLHYVYLMGMQTLKEDSPFQRMFLQKKRHMSCRSLNGILMTRDTLRFYNNMLQEFIRGRGNCIEERLKNARTVKKKLKLNYLKRKGNTVTPEDQLLQKGDLKEAQAAQGMLEGVMSVKEEERKEHKDMQTLEKTAGKKTNSLITTFFTARSKKSCNYIERCPAK
ncbi:hypothetical protein PR048_023929 [Dryococelus australis]|uniref:Uncharacterized protein n=1 Tax=Dryococelus australis TaxID=614101 RepID=A0ABQ9GVK9_9NEOP|nr:hypothetical protein PR048_023929 [Dryococelus australis]